MLPSSDLYKTVIHGPHHRVARVDAFTIDGIPLATNVPVVSGQVSAQLTNRVTRTAQITLSDEWFPRTPESPFSPYQAVVRIRAGVGYGDGSEELWPLITGRVWGVRRAAAGTVELSVDDLAADVVAARFEAPERSSSLSILREIERLISGAIPQATFGADTLANAPTPQLVWDEDRGQALDDLAQAVGGRWYALGDGSFVVRSYSYQPGAPVQQFLDGPQGLMASADVTQTRDGTANSVVVVAERMDGSEPVRRIARDVSPTSPTRWGGPFGRAVQVIKVQTPQSIAQAQTLARTQLAAATALTEQWQAAVVPDYTIEPGDTVRLGYRGYSADQIVDGIGYPLVTGSSMSLTTRSAGTPGVAVGEE
jgi:hypothetical protein